jgi:hypothetical protein
VANVSVNICDGKAELMDQLQIAKQERCKMLSAQMLGLEGLLLLIEKGGDQAEAMLKRNEVVELVRSKKLFQQALHQANEDLSPVVNADFKFEVPSDPLLHLIRNRGLVVGVHHEQLKELERLKKLREDQQPQHGSPECVWVCNQLFLSPYWFHNYLFSVG